MRVLIETQPNMINETDYVSLKDYAEVVYEERDHIDVDELAEKASSFDCLMLNYDVVAPFDARFYSLVKNTKLKLISCDITGMTWAEPVKARENGIILTNIPNYCTNSVAEHIFAQIFLHSRKIHAAYLDRVRNLPIEIRKGFDLKGKTIGILGLGNIGARVAEIAEGVGMDVKIWNYRPKKMGHFSATTDLYSVLSTADIISLNVKTTDDTIGFIDKRTIDQCKDGCIIINQASAKLANLDDVYEALISGKLGGYSGTYKKNLIDMPIYQLPNATFQPANAWLSDDSLYNLRRIWVENTINYINGNIQNQVLD